MEQVAPPRTARQRAELRVGSTLLKWRLDALLGIGGMATVYAATNLQNRSRVALKVLHRELSANHEISERFRREAYVANSVEHDGAVEVREVYLSENDEPVLVMELLKGKSLEEIQEERGTLSQEEVLSYAAQVLDVLAAAHDKGIVHRDIKPQNLFVTQGGRVKVLDFGVARMLEGSASATVTGSLMGTPAFMPPEQAGGRTSAICARSDLWAVAATMFTLLTGRFVHEAENAQAHTIRAAVTPARSLAALLPDAPSALVTLVDRALSFEIEDRFRDAREMQRAVRGAREALLHGADLTGNEASDDGAETNLFPRRPSAVPFEPARTGVTSTQRISAPPIDAPAKGRDDSSDGDDDETAVAKRDDLRAILAARPPARPPAADTSRLPDSDDGDNDETAVAKRDDLRVFMAARREDTPRRAAPKIAALPSLDEDDDDETAVAKSDNLRALLPAQPAQPARPGPAARRAAPKAEPAGTDGDGDTTSVLPARPAALLRPATPATAASAAPARAPAAPATSGRPSGPAVTDVATFEAAMAADRTLPLSGIAAMKAVQRAPLGTTGDHAAPAELRASQPPVPPVSSRPMSPARAPSFGLPPMPAQQRRSTLGRSAVAAIGGGVLVLLVLGYLILRAVL